MGLDLQGLAQRLNVVVVCLGMDGASTGILATCLSEPRLASNVFLVRSPCLLHASSRIVTDHL